ncbi:MAG: hypothetical protein U1E63_16090 [Burkholderiales bacterium]
MNKQEMVDLLVTHETTSAPAAARRRNFARLSERLLERELLFRGLIDFDEPEPGEEDADPGVWSDEINALVSSSRRSRLDNHFFD